MQPPQKKAIDYPFLLVLLFVISIGGYWIVQEIRSHDLDPYLDYLGKKLVAVLPEEKDKQKVQTLYDEFTENVREHKIAPEDVEEVAAEILNLHNLNDTLTARRAEELLASVLPAPENIPAPPERKSHAGGTDFDRKKWQTLSERLGTIYDFENRMEQEKLKEKLRYRIDRGLQIVMDATAKEDLIKAKEEQLIITLENLEKEKFLVWSESFAKDLQIQLDSLSVVLEAYSDSIKLKKIKIPEIQIRAHMDSTTTRNLRDVERRRGLER